MISTLKHIDWPAIFRRWWLSILLLPFIIYHLHQAYYVLRFNIYFSINYNFPFPINLEDTIHTAFLLIVHEAGHTFFGLLGNRTLTILGGSLNEIILASLILIYFIFNKITLGGQYALYLLGLAWIGTGFYAADATARQLPLIGNLGKEAHDWHNLLVHLNLLSSDKTIATIFVFIGAVCFITAILLPFWMNRFKEIHLNLDL